MSERSPWRRRVCGIAAVLVGSSGHAAAKSVHQTDEQLRQQIVAFDESFDPVNRLSGVLLIARGEDIVLHEAFGLAEYELDAPNTLETRFCIASITKEMTKLVVWQLLIEGKLRLDTPLSEYVPDFPRGDEITVEWLLRHRAGFPHRVTDPSETWRPMTAAEMTKFASRSELLIDEMGSESHYSSAGYSVLAHLVEHVEGESFSEVLQRRVFEPAQMHDTADANGRSLVRRRARSYMPGTDSLINAPLQDLSYLVGAGSVVSTAADLRRFFLAFRGDRFHAAAWTALQGEDSAHWTGASNGFHSFLDYDGETDVLVIFLGNTFGGAMGQLRSAVPDMLAGADVATRTRPDIIATVEPDRLEEYAGTYQSRPGAFMTVEVWNGELLIGNTIALPLSETAFYYQPWSNTLSFVADESSGQWRMKRTHANGDIELWPRIEANETVQAPPPPPPAQAIDNAAIGDQLSVTESNPLADEFLEWARERIVPISSLDDPAAFDEVLEAMAPRLENARVVCLGEPDHFIDEKYPFRERFIEQLAPMGFVHIGMEMGRADGIRVQRYLETGDPAVLDQVGLYAAVKRRPPCDSMHGFVDREYAFARMLHRLRSQEPTSAVQFFGFDIDVFPGPGFDDAIGRLESAPNSELRNELIDQLRTLRRNFGPPEEIRELTAAIASNSGGQLPTDVREPLLLDLECLAASFTTRASIMRHGFDSIPFETFAEREEHMFTQFDARLEDLPDDERLILMGHNFHLAHDYQYASFAEENGAWLDMWPSIGAHVNNRLPDQMYVIWLVYDHGDHLASLTQRPANVDTLPGSIEHLLARLNEPAFFLPLAGDPGRPAFLDTPQLVRVNGERAVGVIGAMADAIVFVDAVSTPHAATN